MTQNRYIAHIVIEADTPIQVGSSAMDFWHDIPVQRDWNGLPMILGTSIAGVLRKKFGGDKNAIFGDEDSKKKDAKGSQVIISNALLVDEKGQVCEELLLEKSDFLKIFDTLPIRDHTAITDRGTAKEHAKFDEEVVYKGTRFKFSIEMQEKDKNTFDDILDLLSNPTFRLGGGSTKGFGKFKICEIKTALVDLEHSTSSLNYAPSHCEECTPKQSTSQTHTTYTLTLRPDDFFMFGSGFGDSDANMTPVYEQVVDYQIGDLTTKQILIPASSIKGAIAHRTTFHLNKLLGNTIEAKNGIESVKEIFGEAKNSKQKIAGSKGKILISDCFKQDSGTTKTFDHVISIDRFTGGAIDGALFQEKTIAKKDDNDWYEIEILLENGINEQAVQAFESALTDITTGMLPLGGSTTKGHGVFSGSWSQDAQ